MPVPVADGSTSPPTVTPETVENTRIAWRTAGLLAIVVACFLILGGLGRQVIARIAIDGPIYQQLIQQKDLIADVLPPPLFIVESYLTVLELANPERELDQLVLERKLRLLEQQYRSQQAHWSECLEPGPIRELLLTESTPPALEFYRLANERLIPLVHNRNYGEANKLVRHEMHASFTQHRAVINKLVAHTRAEFQQVRDDANQELASGTIPALCAVSLLLIISVMVSITASNAAMGRRSLQLANQMQAGAKP